MGGPGLSWPGLWGPRSRTGGYRDAMTVEDGNGWVECACGGRHWGRHGAAGLLLMRPGRNGHSSGAHEVLLQLRAAWTHEGGTWGLPGGALDSHEDVVAGALREAAEEAGIDPSVVRIVACLPGVDHGAWSYTYVLGVCPDGTAVDVRTLESDELRWVLLDGVAELPLHSGLAAAWPRLSDAVSSAVSRSPWLCGSADP